MAAGDSDTVAAGVRLGEPSRRQRLAGPAVVVLLVGAVAVVHARTQRAGGDPGGAVLRALEPVARDVPAGAGLVSATHHDAVWSAVCPDNPGGRSGYSAVEVDSVFTTTEPAAAVVAAVGAALAAQGWHPTFAADDAAWQYTPVAEWAKPVPGATSARVVVFAYPTGAAAAPSPGGSTWLLGAEGRTPGYALAGC